MSILGEHIVSLHDKIISLLPTKVKGKEKVAHNSLQPPPEIDNFKLKDYLDLENFLEKKFKGSGAQTINAENFLQGESSKNIEFSDEINRISERYARKPVQRMYYYPRPTPQDVLLEEHEHIITNSYDGKEIYEWNNEGYTDRQIYTIVHRMLMYNTICKTNKNSDKTIADMITVGFAGQLKGWWDNYLNQEQRDKVLQAVKLEGEQYTQNAVYTLVLNIIEHFSGRWSDNSETIRTLLQILDVKLLHHLGIIRMCFYAESWSCQSVIAHIGNPNLYMDYQLSLLKGLEKPSEEKITEGLALCNEIKLNQQIKRHHLNERKQLGEFCEQFAFDIPKQKSKEKEYTPKKKKSSKKEYEK
ncbi:hypothetical protein H5410_060426 [Solanum commersonii]|uniref:DUF7746 domain-containing protein n=1 Tax=Solanum commersonii TaxID=4109 RepID=A0A9J5W5Y9_SOLCO|nr:hypothetical protein H5410_060426 [Solanum commersonii]